MDALTATMFDFKSFTENLGATLKALTPRITVPFAVTGWLLLYIHTAGWMVLPQPVVVSALVVGLLCTWLATASATGAAYHRLVPVLLRRGERRRIEAELEFLTPKERKILAYLLAKRQRMFQVQPDGEEASTLIAKGFVAHLARHAPVVHRDISVEVPAHVWEVLVKHREEFPYDESADRGHPWRTHWMAR